MRTWPDLPMAGALRKASTRCVSGLTPFALFAGKTCTATASAVAAPAAARGNTTSKLHARTREDRFTEGAPASIFIDQRIRPDDTRRGCRLAIVLSRA